MAEWQLFEPGTVPECATAAWYAERERAPHLEQGGHRERLDLAARMARQAMERWQLDTIVDLGAGDGGFLSLLGDAWPAWGYDLQPTNVAGAAERGVNVVLGDFLGDDVTWADLAVATEVIEHLIDPHTFVATLFGRCKVVVASSPRLETPGRHYEHHLWAWDERGYRALFEAAGWVVERHEACSIFQVLMAVRP